MSGRVLVLGGGVREHALARWLAADPAVAGVFVAPGNAGIEGRKLHACPVPDLDARTIVPLADRLRPDLTVIGPEAPLVAGLADALRARGHTTLGPSASAARLEGSKVWARGLAREIEVPTPAFTVTADDDAARAWAASRDHAVVVKQDGLAGGKGSFVCASPGDVTRALAAIPTRPVVVEARQTGPERTVMALCDGERAIPLPLVIDHKRLGDGDTGPMTGGMGALSLPGDRVLAESLCDAFVRPALRALATRGAPFRGVLYAGVLRDRTLGWRLLEWNVRPGDPEIAAALARLDGPALAPLRDAATGTLGGDPWTWREEYAFARVFAAPGYPSTAAAVPLRVDDGPGVVLHGATARDPDGALRAAGGRVLCALGSGSSRESALSAVYAASARVHGEGLQARADLDAWGRE